MAILNCSPVCFHSLPPVLHQWTEPFRQGSCRTFQDNLCSRLPAYFPKQQVEALLFHSQHLSQRSSCPLKIFCMFYFLGTWNSFLHSGSPTMNIWKCGMGNRCPVLQLCSIQPSDMADPKNPASNPVIRTLSVISVTGLNLYRLFAVFSFTLS